MTEILTGKNILVAEDNLTNQIVISKMLDRLGAKYDVAADGIEAIEKFNTQSHDLALLDIEMPRKSGLEVIRNLRERHDVGQDYPIVVLTAFVLGEHQTRIREAGATGILAKPITDISKFGEVLLGYIENSKKGECNREGFDPNAMKELVSTVGSDVMPEVLHSVISDLNRIHSELENLDQAQLNRHAHSIVSIAEISGGLFLYEAAQEIEAHTPDIGSADWFEAHKKLMMLISNHIKEVENYRNEYYPK